ncbi:phage distal tail protein domain-containing protein [Enterococcus sp. AZ080]|uniref:phage distal tail protein domain-containing protein n=1 Tax=Enterococcus sp. AZ080 TaxID=2774793 RepID=UPI003F2025BD
MQHLSIENSHGDTWLIDNTHSLRASNVNGLGIGFETDYLSENGHSRIEKHVLKQHQFEAYFHFGRRKNENAYQVYYSFVEFLSFSPLYLIYTTDAGQKRALITVSMLSKSSIQQGGFLKESIIIDRLSPWYTVKYAKIHQKNINVNAHGKVYNYVRPYVYTQNAHEKKGNYRINNRSLYLSAEKNHLTPLRIKITGYCVNPRWEIFQGSKLISSDGYFLTLQEEQQLVVSSLFQERTAILIGQNGLQSSVYQQQDITKNGFVHAPVGESIIVFHIGTAEVEIAIYEEADLF